MLLHAVRELLLALIARAGYLDCRTARSTIVTGLRPNTQVRRVRSAYACPARITWLAHSVPLLREGIERGVQRARCSHAAVAEARMCRSASALEASRPTLHGRSVRRVFLPAPQLLAAQPRLHCASLTVLRSSCCNNNKK